MRARDTEKQEEMCLAIELWRDSGLSQKIYCEQEGYTISKFKYWIKKLGNAKPRSKSESKIKPKKTTPEFIPVDILEKEQKNTEGSTFEIHYPNGVKIICRENLESSKLQTLIQIV